MDHLMKRTTTPLACLDLTQARTTVGALPYDAIDLRVRCVSLAMHCCADASDRS